MRMTDLRMRMFAGPNGSGKSTLKDELKPEWLGVYINADEIEKSLKIINKLDFSHYQISVNETEFKSFFIDPPDSNISGKLGLLLEKNFLSFRNNTVYFNSNEINSYHASLLADFIRRKLIDNKISFSFETVMSHPEKVDLLKIAQKCGFKTYLYFVATEDPEINVERVQIRVENGGHSVPEDKIRERYVRSLNLLSNAIEFTDRAYIFDNSGGARAFIAEITNGSDLKYHTSSVPHWFKISVLDKFETN
jgi:predicted ABC-type ATPase